MEKPDLLIETKIVDLAKEGKPQQQIAADTGKSMSYISGIERKHGILPTAKVMQMLTSYYMQEGGKEISNEEWADRTGLYPETIEEFKKEALEVVQAKKILINIILEKAKRGELQRQIAADTGKSLSYVSGVVREHGVLPTVKVMQMLANYYIQGKGKEISNEEWANKTGLYPETIAKLKKKVLETINVTIAVNSEPQEQMVRNTAEIPNKVNTSSNDEAKIEELAKRLGISQQQVKKVRLLLTNLPSVKFVANRLNISSNIVNQIKEQLEKEKYEKTHTVDNYKAKMQDLRKTIQSEDISNNAKRQQEITYEIETLLRQFDQFLTKEDYAMLAYGYIKIGEPKKAMQIGVLHLRTGMHDLPTLKNKIDEVLNQAIQEQRNGQTIVASRPAEDHSL